MRDALSALQVQLMSPRIGSVFAFQLDCIPERRSLQRLMFSSPPRHYPSNQVPEGPGVVLLDGVAEFMDDDVFAYPVALVPRRVLLMIR